MLIWLFIFRIALAVLLSVTAVQPGSDSESASESSPVMEALSAILTPPADEQTTQEEEIIDEPPPEDETSGTESPGGVVGEGVSVDPEPTPTTEPTSTQTAPSSTAQATSTATSSLTRTPSPSTTPGQTRTPTPTATATPTETVLRGTRYDDPVLRWLPELKAASRAHGVSVALLAGTTMVGSGGEPGIIRSDGRIGLLALREEDLQALGLPESEWHDPAKHLDAGGQVLASLRSETGAWKAAIGEFVGEGCDALNQCQADYVAAILAWRDYYSGVLRDPEAAGLAKLPRDWTPPEIEIVVETEPRPLVWPPEIATPTPTEEAGTPTATDSPTELPETTETTEASPSDEATAAPTETPVEPPESESPQPTATEGNGDWETSDTGETGESETG
ncbi:MAG TPA: hypothetical protein VIL01_11310 [Thermomicrobiales bacterium]